MPSLWHPLAGFLETQWAILPVPTLIPSWHYHILYYWGGSVIEFPPLRSTILASLDIPFLLGLLPSPCHCVMTTYAPSFLFQNWSLLDAAICCTVEEEVLLNFHLFRATNLASLDITFLLGFFPSPLSFVRTTYFWLCHNGIPNNDMCNLINTLYVLTFIYSYDMSLNLQHKPLFSLQGKPCGIPPSSLEYLDRGWYKRGW